jgi:uncharacterized protein (DUF924 family)
VEPADVLAFWRDAGPKKWFAKNDAFDSEIRERFLATYEAAANGALSHWEMSPDGAYALIIVLDQFPRNMFRGDARTFAADPLARAVADRALARGHDRQFAPSERTFFYLPYEHSEDLADQERSVTLAQALGPRHARHALRHRDIIARFGRFPHRNALLGRTSTPEELAYLAAGGFAG